MKKLDWKMITIMLTVTIVVIFIGNYLLNKYLNIMLLEKLVPHIKKWEGDLSRDPNDKAASNPAPWTHKGQTGWHTKRGVTYTTFVNLANKLNYKISPENFFTMPDDLWLKILKAGYMSPFPLDRIAHLPRIQAVIITWAWGSGTGGAEKYLADFQRDIMGINDSNITKDEIIENFRKKINPINEIEWFNKLNERRLQDFKTMPTWNVHGTGWTNRLNDFKQVFA
jgi:hypothetical protein